MFQEIMRIGGVIVDKVCAPNEVFHAHRSYRCLRHSWRSWWWTHSVQDAPDQRGK